MMPSSYPWSRKTRSTPVTRGPEKCEYVMFSIEGFPLALDFSRAWEILCVRFREGIEPKYGGRDVTMLQNTHLSDDEIAASRGRRDHCRQTIYAIEAGTYVPNTEVALNLDRHESHGSAIGGCKHSH